MKPAMRFVTWILSCPVLAVGGIGDQPCYSAWATSQATLTVEAVRQDGGWAYRLEYAIPESRAINRDGHRIVGPIVQYGTSENRPASPQHVKIRYRKDEPIIFEYIDRPDFGERTRSSVFKNLEKKFEKR